MKREVIEGEIKGKREIERGRESVNRMNRKVKGIVMVMMIVMECNTIANKIYL
ncbi:Variable outer membrane protein [Borrelia duttonii CR2A]|uniref:Variable outer membrane protein n=1 Tax=Borrelia duttonii CR2A TaxID=1432657 RepID=W6TEQ0_9SPIR|nr:hypothetical protein [Borrelia duttonii]ETZ17042.1 Variable outer membrane protein [Borrelia duttonii CR2A]